jgi:hypothetical protein
MSRFLVLFLLIISDFGINAQQMDLTEELVEQLSGDMPESIPESVFSDEYLIEEIRIKNLNKVSRSALDKIPWLTPLHVENLLDYIDRSGPLVSIYELQAVPGWDLSTVRMTAAVAEVPETGAYYDPRSIKEQLQQEGGVELQFRLKRRVQLSRGYLEKGKSSFRGAPYYWLGRFRYQKKGNLRIGINMEKDPGERFSWNPEKGRYGADHVSMYLQLENKGPVRRLILGDFRVQWDQGLVMGGGLSFNKQVITSPRKVHQGFLVHSGTREFDFYRGMGIELETGPMEISIMYSYRKLDARLLQADLTTGLPPRVSSIIRTGLHRTEVEVEKMNQLPEQLMGLHLRKRLGQNLIISASGVYRAWKFPLIPEQTRYNRYTYSGNHNINLSAGIEYLWRNMNFFSQFAISHSNDWAAAAGFIASLSHRATMTVHIRNYQKQYHSKSGGGFGISGSNINEQGVYWGLQIMPSAKWTMSSSMNIYRLPHASYGSDQPSMGMEHLLRLQYIPDRSTYVDFYFRHRNKLVNDKPVANKNTYHSTEENKQSLGLRARWQNADHIALQSRIQHSRYQINSVRSHGMIVANQVSYAYKFLRFTVSMAHFNTDDFENRQYIYEKDLPYSLSIPFFDGIGTRWFCMLQLKLPKNLDLWAKIAQSNYQDRDQVGSGPDIINGSKRTDLSLQIRYKM